MDFSPHLFVSHVIDSPRFVSICMKSWLAQGSWRVSLKRGVRGGAGIDVYLFFVLFCFLLKIFFQHEKRNFVSPSGHVMFYLLYKHQ